MNAPRLIGFCRDRLLLAQEESQFPIGCDWIEPIPSLAPYAFALIGALALASLAQSLVRGARYFIHIRRELRQIREGN